MKLLEGKVAIITGATRGIGKGIAEVFAQNGANIAFTYVSSDEQAKKVVDELTAYGVKVKSYKSNAAIYSDAEVFIDQVVADFGKIDAIVNNAGITRDGLLMRMTEENWDEVMNVNLKSVFNITKCALKTLLKQRYGSIINMSSVVGIEGNAGQSNYAASKAGVVALTTTWAKELGRFGIRVGAIAPGVISTAMTDVMKPEAKQRMLAVTPVGRLGETAEIAHTAQYIIENDFFTGRVVEIDGGIRL